MGVEPIYSSSAGCRLNGSATPALIFYGLIGNKNIVGLRTYQRCRMMLLAERIYLSVLGIILIEVLL